MHVTEPLCACTHVHILSHEVVVKLLFAFSLRDFAQAWLLLGEWCYCALCICCIFYGHNLEALLSERPMFCTFQSNNVFFFNLFILLLFINLFLSRENTMVCSFRQQDCICFLTQKARTAMVVKNFLNWSSF